RSGLFLFPLEARCGNRRPSRLASFELELRFSTLRPRFPHPGLWMWCAGFGEPVQDLARHVFFAAVEVLIEASFANEIDVAGTQAQCFSSDVHFSSGFTTAFRFILFLLLEK